MASNKFNKSAVLDILNGKTPPTDWHGVWRKLKKLGGNAPEGFIAAATAAFPDAFKPAAPVVAEVPNPAPSTECVTPPPAPAAVIVPDAAPAPATPAKKRGRPANPDKPVKPPKAVSTTPYRAGSIYDKLTLLCLANDGMSMDDLFNLAESKEIMPRFVDLLGDGNLTATGIIDRLNSFNAAMGVIRGPTGFSNRGKTECVGTNKAVSLRVLSMTPTRPDRSGNMAGMSEEDKATWPARLAAETAAADEAKQNKEKADAEKAATDAATKALRKAEKTAARTAEKATADAEKAKKKADKAQVELKAAQDKVEKIKADLKAAQEDAEKLTSVATATPETPATAETAAPGESIPAAASEVSQTADTVAEVPAD